MIFSPQMLPLVLDGSKTQTRRKSSRYKVGHVYAVQPGRGKHSVAHIKIIAKRRQRLGEIRTVDAVAEGFDSRARFLDSWAAMIGPPDPHEWVFAYEFALVP